MPIADALQVRVVRAVDTDIGQLSVDLIVKVNGEHSPHRANPVHEMQHNAKPVGVVTVWIMVPPGVSGS